MMFRVAICDDDNAICSLIERILLSYKGEAPIPEIEVFYSGKELLQHINANNYCFDLLFLDIELGDMKGIDVGQKIRKELNDYATSIVFISGLDKYDRQLFDIQPLNFISKPPRKTDILYNLELANKLKESMNRLFQYQKNYDYFNVPINKILYFKSHGRQVMILTTDGQDRFYGKLDYVSAKLAMYRFIRISRTIIINYHYVEKFTYEEVTMTNGEKLSITKTYRDGVRELLIQEI